MPPAFIYTAMKTMPGLGLRLWATGIPAASGNDRNCFEKMARLDEQLKRVPGLKMVL